MVFQNVYSTIPYTKSLGGSGLHSLAPLHRHPGVSLGQMVSELLEQKAESLVTQNPDITITAHVGSVRTW